MNEKEKKILDEILSEALDGFKIEILEKMDDNLLQRLKILVDHMIKYEDSKLSDKDLFYVKKDIIMFLYKNNWSDPTGYICSLFDALLKDLDFKKYDKIYYKEKRIDEELLDLLIKKYGFLVWFIKTYHTMIKSNISYDKIENFFKKNDKITDGDMMYIVIYNGVYAERLDETLMMIGD